VVRRIGDGLRHGTRERNLDLLHLLRASAVVGVIDSRLHAAAIEPSAHGGVDDGFPECADNARGLEMRCRGIAAVRERAAVIGMAERNRPERNRVAGIQRVLAGGKGRIDKTDRGCDQDGKPQAHAGSPVFAAPACRAVWFNYGAPAGCGPCNRRRRVTILRRAFEGFAWLASERCSRPGWWRPGL